MSNIAHEVIKKYVGKPNPKYYNLPSEYIQLEYIQSDMINYFDSGIEVSSNLKIVADFQLVYKQYGYEFCLFGVRNDNSRIRCSIGTNDQLKIENNTYSQSSDIYAKTTVTALPESGYTSSDQSIYIFAQNQLNIPYSIFGICKLYSLKVYNNNILTYEFIPAIRKSDNEIGLYKIDLNNNEESEFLKSCSISSKTDKFQQIEYLEGTGAQYIDTGYKAVTNTGFFVKFSNNDEIGQSNVGAIFGACNSSHTGYYVDTWTNNSNKGSFRKAGTLYDPGLIKDTILIRNHSTVTNTLTNSDTSYISTNTTSNTTPVYMYIFAYNKEDSGITSRSKTKLYLLAFVEQWEPIHIYVPVINISKNNKPGLYDIIEQKFLVNSGQEEFLTGQPIQAFTAGPEIYPEVATEITDTYISHKILPKNYTQLSYIQNTGLSYFNTDTTVINENTKIEADFQYVDKKFGFESIVGGVWNDSSRCRIGNNADNIFAATGNNTISQTTDIFARTIITATPNTGYNQSNKSITIFCQNNYDTETKLSFYNILKLYSFKIYDNNELIKHYIPAKYNNKIGLYEIIDGEFKVDQTGIPPEYTQVEYIESTGTQYINTNYIVATSTGFFTRFTTNNSIGNDDYGAIFGNCDDNKNGFFLETYTDELDSTHKGRFHYGSLSTNDPLITPNELMTIGYSYGKQALVRTDNTSIRNITPVEVTNVPLYLFACNNNNTEVLAPSRTKLYSFIILEGVRVIHNYVPVISTTNNQIIPGLYDTTVGEFFTNSNSQGSDFLYGNIVTENLISGEEIPPVARKVVKTYIGA